MKASEVLASVLAEVGGCEVGCPTEAPCSLCRGAAEEQEANLLAQVPEGHDLVVRQDGTMGVLVSAGELLTEEEANAGPHKLMRVRPLSSPAPVSGSDPEPQPSDGPEYHADYAAWAARQASPVSEEATDG